MLLGGSYQGRSPIAARNRLVNLYPERNPPDGSPPTPVTYYQTPGLNKLSDSPLVEGMRWMYRASNGQLYAVVGPQVYHVSSSFAWTLLGSIPDGTTPLGFADNGTVIVLVDGSATGYAIDMTSNAFGTITDPSFYGGRSAVYLDTYFIFNRPNTAQFYISLSNVTYEMLTGVTGRILSGSIASGGSSYTDGTYSGQALTGGTGSGATADIVVSGGAITSVTLVDTGTGYAVGDVLSAGIAGGSGFGYSVDSVATAFDPLDIASKTGSADNIVAVATVHGELWLIGELASEIWADTGAADFPFERIGGAFVDHGCGAPYSLSQQDVSLFWLAQDRQGHGIVVKSNGYGLEQISTHDIEQELQDFGTISDAVGYCHQIQGHAFYVLILPSADITFGFDLATGQWHRWASRDGNGVLHRHRSSCFAFAYGYNLVGDYQNGSLYSLDRKIYTDNSVSIPRIVTFPHITKNGQRVIYTQFQAKMEVGTAEGTTTDDPPLASLRWSDDAGQSWGNYVTQSIGAAGQYLTSPQWQKLGVARDRVFELSWDADAEVAINSAYINFKVART